MPPLRQREILPEDLPETLLEFQGADSFGPLKYHDAVREAKRSIVFSAMQKASGNHGDAARLLGLHVNNLHRLIRELELKSILADAGYSSAVSATPEPALMTLRADAE